MISGQTGGIRSGREKSRAAILSLLLMSMLSACVAADAPPPRPAQKPSAPTSRPVPMPAPNPGPRLAMPEPVRPAVGRPPDGLENLISDQWRLFPGKTGVAVMRIDGGDWVTGKRLGDLFPQQSVSKTWVAMTVLDMVDQGKLRLDQRVRITRDDLAVFHQPIRDRVIANGEIEESVLSLLEQAIRSSDNTANDSLLRTVGGPQAVRSFIARKNLGAIRFGPGERLLQSGIAGIEWRQEYAYGRSFYAARDAAPYAQRKSALDRYLADPVDGATPEAIVRALARLAKGQLLAPDSTRLLLDIMSHTSSGPNRLKAGVPAGWRFLHKTGTGQILPPVSTGYNDIGIMTAPDGTRYAVAVMIGDTTASIPDRMAFMQFVSRTVATYHQR
jgi:beta-lactamase class A